jgi:hypothetical protein
MVIAQETVFCWGFSSLVNHGGLTQALLFNYLPTNNPPAGAGAQQKTVSGDQLSSILYYNELVDADSLWPLYAGLCWVSRELGFQVILPCSGC